MRVNPATALDFTERPLPCLVPDEVNNMHRFFLFAGLLVGVTLIAPVVLKADADDHPYNARYYNNRRYFDNEHRDYHVWNNQEDRAYRFYLGEQHRPWQDWRYVRGPERREYFGWRHTHPDNVIVVK
jgi:hypothetical protein